MQRFSDKTRNSRRRSAPIITVFGLLLLTGLGAPPFSLGQNEPKMTRPDVRYVLPGIPHATITMLGPMASFHSGRSKVKTYSGDMAPRPMLKELIRIGAVVELENLTYKAIRREFEPEALSPELVERLGVIGHYFFSTG